MYIVTGSNDNHIKSLRNMITSFFKCCNKNDSLIVYNLGITDKNWEYIQADFPKCIFKVFDYSKYPSYYNIKINAGQYAWKPAIIKECLDFISSNDNVSSSGGLNGILVWMDAGNLISNNLNELEETILKNNLYSPISSLNIKDLTHQTTLLYMKTPLEFLFYTNRNGACVGFNTKTEWVKQFIVMWAKLASVRECIAPKGSSRKNHRQDQSVFTILYYFYQNEYKFRVINNYIGYSIHNDVD